MRRAKGAEQGRFRPQGGPVGEVGGGGIVRGGRVESVAHVGAGELVKGTGAEAGGGGPGAVEGGEVGGADLGEEVVGVGGAVVGGGDGDEGADVYVVFDGRILLLCRFLLLVLILLLLLVLVLVLLFLLGSGETRPVRARLANHVSRI